MCTYVPTYTHICPCMAAYIYIHTYIHTYMHTYIHTYMHTYIHAIQVIILDQMSKMPTGFLLVYTNVIY